MPLVTIDRTTGTNIGNMTVGGGLAAAFDGETSEPAAGSNCAFSDGSESIKRGYIGKTLAAPRVFGRAVVYGSSTQGFLNGSDSITINIRGKTGAAPSSRTDGTIVGTTSFTDASDESGGRSIATTDSTTKWDHLFVDIVGAGGGAAIIRVGEVVFETPVASNQSVIFG